MRVFTYGENCVILPPTGETGERRVMTDNIAPLPLRAAAGRVLWRCAGYLRPYLRLTVGAYLAVLVTNAIALLTPQFIRWIVDHGIGRQDTRLLAVSVLTLLAITLLKGVLTFLQGQWTETASQNVAYDLRNAIHAQLSTLSFSYHDRAETGQILSRAIQDVDRIRFVTGRAFLRLAEGALLLVGTAAVLLWMNPRLALLALLTMPLLVYRALDLSRQLRPLSLAVQEQLGVLTTRLEQNLRGARVVKAFAQESSEIARFAEQNDRWFALSARSARLQAWNMPLQELIANASMVFIVGYGGLLVMRGGLTLGELVAFSTYLGQLFQPVRRLGLIIPAMALAAAAGERVFEILDAVSEVQELPDAVPLP
ncbi:MAG: ABC transporter ATP-binding protein, partial [Chloroflexi bacterium]|nr:ABC transporter ATP-binding protein [Chloroflexota bacterium]